MWQTHTQKNTTEDWHLPCPDLTWKAVRVALLAISLSRHRDLWGRPDSCVYGWSIERGRDSGKSVCAPGTRETPGEGILEDGKAAASGTCWTLTEGVLRLFSVWWEVCATFPDEWAGEIQPAKWTEGRLWNWQAGVWLCVLLFTNWVMGKLIAFAFLLLCDSHLVFFFKFY